MPETFDDLIGKFEQCWSLDAFIAVEEGTAEGDENYIRKIRAMNNLVYARFTEAGDAGVEYLAAVVNGGNLDLQERAVAILCHIGKSSGSCDKFRIRDMLEYRRAVEGETCVCRRIDYALEQLGE